MRRLTSWGRDSSLQSTRYRQLPLLLSTLTTPSLLPDLTLTFTLTVTQALDKLSSDGRIVAVKKIKLGSRAEAKDGINRTALRYLVVTVYST